MSDPNLRARNELLAREIFEFLKKNEMWGDTAIFFNGGAISTPSYFRDKGHRRDPNDPSVVIVADADPRRHFKWVPEDDAEHILSMIFEGHLYSVLNFGHEELRNQFDAIFEKYGVYYEQGDAWNLTCYENPSRVPGGAGRKES